MRQPTADGEAVFLRVRARAEAEVVAGENLRGGFGPIHLLQRDDVGTQFAGVLAATKRSPRQCAARAA